MLNGECFYKDSHRKIYSAVVKLFDENKGVDLVTVVEELKKSGSLDEAGGPAYISGLASGVPTSANFIHYARIIKEKMLLRKLISTSTQIVSGCYEQSQDVDMLLDKAEQLIFDITSK
jgi:replicative DNA helicase